MKKGGKDLWDKGMNMNKGPEVRHLRGNTESDGQFFFLRHKILGGEE
jgi:hypothetical protein